MTILALILFCGIASYMSLRSSFQLFKLGSSVAWIALFLYVKDHPITGTSEGDPYHVVLLLAIAVAAIAVMIYSIGIEIQKGKEDESGLSFPRLVWNPFYKRDEESEWTNQQRRDKANQDYRQRLRAAYRQYPEKRNNDR